MKNKFLLIIPIVIIALAAIFFFVRQSQSVQAQTTITLVRESGTVLFKETEEAEYKDMDDDEIEIPSGSFIKTKENAYARVFLPDNSLISLDQDTEIQVKAEGNKFNIDQFIGQTWNRVQSVSNGGEFNVKTPNTIAAVRGTVFGVTVQDENITYVFVNDGKVEVNRYQMEGDEVKIIETVTLEKDDLVQVLKNSQFFKFNMFELNEDWRNYFWFQRNLVLDEIYFRLIQDSILNLRLNMTLELQNNEKREFFRFDLKSGASDISVDELKEKLGAVINITQIDENTCVRNTSADFSAAADLLNSYSEYVQDYGKLNDFLNTLSSMCEDTILNAQEIESLQSQIAQF